MLKSLTKKLKLAHQDFRNVSLELSRWYSKNGSHSNSSEVDEDRRAIFGEYKLVYGKLNDRISELGLVPGSSIGNPSECGQDHSIIERSVELVTKWLEKTSDNIVNSSDLSATHNVASSLLHVEPLCNIALERSETCGAPIKVS